MLGVWYRQKLRDTREASNGGRVRVHIIHGLTISHKEFTYLLQKSTSHQNKVLHACSQGKGWQELTIARSRPPQIRKAIKQHPMLQICYTTFTIRACYGTCQLQHKYFSNSQLLYQHDSNITILISQNNHQASNLSQHLVHFI